MQLVFMQEILVNRVKLFALVSTQAKTIKDFEVLQLEQVLLSYHRDQIVLQSDTWPGPLLKQPIP